MKSDEEDIAIDSEAFGRHANLKGIHIKVCQSCGTEDPVLLVHDNGNASTALVFARDGSTLMRSLPVVTVECDTCGYLYLYNRRKVAETLKGDSDG
ncbi:hypothetical protein ACNHE5_01020 [Pandoraea pnomenusa]|uniref:hypothetical protein n=1 Tax=Pandoraea pnomenusa TaxID=93220 RepID=UPI003CE690AF